MCIRDSFRRCILGNSFCWSKHHFEGCHQLLSVGQLCPITSCSGFKNSFKHSYREKTAIRMYTKDVLKWLISVKLCKLSVNASWYINLDEGIALFLVVHNIFSEIFSILQIIWQSLPHLVILWYQSSMNQAGNSGYVSYRCWAGVSVSSEEGGRPY